MMFIFCKLIWIQKCSIYKPKSVQIDIIHQQLSRFSDLECSLPHHPSPPHNTVAARNDLKTAGDIASSVTWSAACHTTLPHCDTVVTRTMTTWLRAVWHLDLTKWNAL